MLGLDDDDTLGEALEDKLGDDVGVVLGLDDGATLGEALGEKLGDNVGVVLGDNVGVMLGLGDGAASVNGLCASTHSIEIAAEGDRGTPGWKS